MSEPTICAKCKYDEPPERRIFGGHHRCMAEPETRDFVTGKMVKPTPPCSVRNALGKCADFARKGA
jgi:hypothetical protein